MAYILLALGVAMSLAGLTSMAIGYPMIEIERGWAMLITGAVLLSGGLVVVALGFVVRHLIGLRSVLAAGHVIPRATVPQAAAIPAPPLPPAMVGATSPNPLAVTSSPIHSFGTAAGATVPAALAGSVLFGREEPEAPHEPTHGLAPFTSVHEPHTEANEGPEAHVPEAHPLETSERPNDDEAHEPAEHVAGTESSPISEGDRPKSGEALLDQAFSAFDYEMSNGHPPAETTPPPNAHESHAEPAVEPALAEAAHLADSDHESTTAGPEVTQEPLLEPDAEHVDESHQHHAADVTEPPIEAPATAPAEPDPNLAVIGRYDSEGTSYVMYSDGSIEAQSESGVYRFSSMAELKAFIEG